MRDVRTSWESGCVLVCTNERRPGSSRASCGQEKGIALRQWLKDRQRAEGFRKRILITRSGCLDVCPKGGVAIAILPPPGGEGERKVMVVDPEADREALWQEIHSTLLQAAE